MSTYQVEIPFEVINNSFQVDDVGTIDNQNVVKERQ